MKHYLLLVDDEVVIRAGLHAMIQEHFPEEYAVLEAKDGTQALSILSNNPVDIVITDVKMPEMTGLELMHKAKEMGYHCKFAMISGYDDFDLVREALVNGALDYFLKPIPTCDLISFLTKLSDQLQQTSQNDQHLEFQFSGISQPQQQNLLDQLFASRDIHSFLRLLRESGCRIEEPCALFLTSEDPTGNREELRKKCARELEEFGILSTKDGQLISGTCRHGWAFLDISAVPSRQAAFLAFCQYLRAQQPKSSSQDCYIESSSLLALRDACIHDLELCFYNYTDGPQTQDSPDSCKRSLFQNIISKDEKQAQHCLNILFSALNQSEMDIASVRKFLSDLLYELMSLEPMFISIIGKLRFQKIDLPLTVQTGDSMSALHRSFSAGILRCIQEYSTRSQGQDSAAIRQAKEYVQQHYQENITLNDIADHLHLHPNYFSTFFREHTGGTFRDYLRAVRIAAAKKLLRGPEMKIYEVAVQVGYADAAHFNRAFKAVVGLSPQEWKQLH